MKLEFVFKNGDKHTSEVSNEKTFTEVVNEILRNDWAVCGDLAFRTDELTIIREVKESE